MSHRKKQTSFVQITCLPDIIFIIINDNSLVQYNSYSYYNIISSFKANFCKILFCNFYIVLSLTSRLNLIRYDKVMCLVISILINFFRILVPFAGLSSEQEHFVLPIHIFIFIHCIIQLCYLYIKQF